MIIGTFADDGPRKCSGLDVERYDIRKMRETVGEDLQLLTSFREVHATPSGATQNFLYALFRKNY